MHHENRTQLICSIALCNDVENGIKEVTHTIKCGIRRACAYKNLDYPHYYDDNRYDILYDDTDPDGGFGVFQITLRNGRIIALDLCGQQFYRERGHGYVKHWEENCDDLALKIDPLRATSRIPEVLPSLYQHPYGGLLQSVAVSI